MLKRLLLISCMLCISNSYAGIILLDGGNPDVHFVFKSGTTSSNITWQWLNGTPNINKIGLFIGSDIDGSPRGKYLDLLEGPNNEKKSSITYSEGFSHFKSSIDEEFIVGSNIFIELYAVTDKFWYSREQRNRPQIDVWDLQWIDDNKLMATLFDNNVGVDSFRLTINNVAKVNINNAQGSDPVNVPEPPLWSLFALSFIGLAVRKKHC